MAYIATVTNTRINPLMLYYRPYGSTKDQPKPLIQVLLPSRALNHQVAFTDELYFKAFKEQNAAFINNETIIIGEKTREKTAIEVNERNAVEEQKAVKAKKDAIVSNLEKSTSGSMKKSKIKLSVEKD